MSEVQAGSQNTKMGGQSMQSQAHSSSNKNETRSNPPGPDKGTGYYPLSDLQFDVISIIYDKSKALQVYDKYLSDAQANTEVRDILERIKAADRQAIEMLKKHLGNC
jgi:hypothetical protein